MDSFNIFIITAIIVITFNMIVIKSTHTCHILKLKHRFSMQRSKTKLIVCWSPLSHDC